jgi:hypothetical protein
MALTCRDDLPDGHSEIFLPTGLDREFANQPVEAGQEVGHFRELMYDSVYDESRIQDR